jgi:branched-subunit amino acid aminotransferase/4-amino-4-deoxychorismate lyase
MFSGDASTLSHALNPLPTIWLLHLRAEAVEAFPSTPPASSLRLKTVAFEQAVPQLKHGALLPAWLVKRQALQIASAVDEIIWQAPTGELLETTTGNLFFFMADGTLRTAEAEKVLSGITRQQVKKVCQQDVLPLIEQAIHWQSEATQVMGAFTTNSVKGLVAVESLNGVALNWDAKTLDQWHTLYTAWLASLGLEGCYRTL